MSMATEILKKERGPASEGALVELLLAFEAILAKQAATSRPDETDFVLDSDSRKLGIDNRATAFISGDINDFEGPLSESGKVVRGFGGQRVTGAMNGTAVIRLEDDHGIIHKFRLPNSYYVPGSKDRLFSPQHWAQELRKQKLGPATETTDADKVVLQWGPHRRTICLDPRTNVATIRTAPSYDRFVAYCAEAGFDDPSLSDHPIAFDAAMVSDDESSSSDDDSSLPSARGDEDEQWTESHLPNTNPQSAKPNLIEQDENFPPKPTDEAQLLEIHNNFGHAHFSKLQEMARQGTIPRRLSKCRIPLCAACMFGKATKRPWRSKLSDNRAESFAPTRPGQVVAVDQLKSPTPGFIAHLTGKLTTSRYTYATVFVDAYSGRGYVHLQKTQSGAETLEAKLAWERICQQEGIKVEHYHADNGIFRGYEWMADCLKKGQGMTFAGVDAHHQNGKAEARIRRLQELTRSMLLHAKRRWPQEISANLWPYALRMANESINATPNMSDKLRRSPDQIFLGTEVTTNPKHWKPFGCPVYVLDPSLRGSTRIHHKWKDRSRVGIYLGRSPHHNRNVALVLNPETGLVSPQYHVKFDPHFDTVKQLYGEGTKHMSMWQVKAGLVRNEEQARALAEQQQSSRQLDGKSVTNVSKKLTQTGKRGEGTPERAAFKEVPAEYSEGAADSKLGKPAPSNGADPAPSDVPKGARPADQSASTADHNKIPTQTRRSQRKRKPVERLVEAQTVEIEESTGAMGEIFSYQALFPRDDDDYSADIYALKAKADPDTLYLHEAMRQPDWENFGQAMETEIEEQISKGLYTLRRRSEVPEGAKVLKAVWQLRRKRDIRTKEIKKYKARCNIDGSKMVYGEHYKETYAPVAGWTAIRLLLALVLLCNWKTVQLDYVLAFPQAPAVRDLYMEIPKGFTLDGVDNPKEWVLQVNRNLYGGKDAGRTWFLFLKSKLEQLGFEQSKHDDCIFYKGNMIYVLYTDDSILAGPDQREIDKTVEEISKALDITVEGTLTDFLGVNIDRRDDGTIKLSQPRLIDQVLEDLHLNQKNTTTRETPMMSSKILSRHEDDRPFDKHFDYRSVIGKLHYLVAGSRNELAYSVHQCARFSHEPRMKHAQAVKNIGRYLKGTRDEGTIMRPDPSRPLEVYVDADFAGNYDPQLAGRDRATARSRHGFYILYGGIPIAWKSTLQTEIALSTTEAEITGLSYALREAIPVMNLLIEMKERGYPVNAGGPKVHCRVFEDNSGAIEIAKTHKFRPRTKHLNNKLFHFRSYVDKGLITIHPIDTKNQPADILTKPLNEEEFKHHRKAINGW